MADSENGVVKWYNAARGFGFIGREKPGAKDVFLHATDLRKSGIQGDVDEGQELTFEVAPTPRGIKAVNIKLRGGAEAAAGG